jgi:hypothetical protein
MISFKLNAQARNVEIYRDNVLIEVCTLAQKSSRLQALGHVSTVKPEQGGTRGAKNGYGWSKSAQIGRGA